MYSNSFPRLLPHKERILISPCINKPWVSWMSIFKDHDNLHFKRKTFCLKDVFFSFLFLIYSFYTIPFGILWLPQWSLYCKCASYRNSLVYKQFFQWLECHIIIHLNSLKCINPQKNLFMNSKYLFYNQLNFKFFILLYNYVLLTVIS